MSYINTNKNLIRENTMALKIKRTLYIGALIETGMKNLGNMPTAFKREKV